eukprot:15480962-Alexandrium_andersonii.AAC.1
MPPPHRPPRQPAAWAAVQAEGQEQRGEEPRQLEALQEGEKEVRARPRPAGRRCPPRRRPRP